MLQNTTFIYYYFVLQEFGRYGFGEKDKKEKKSKRCLQHVESCSTSNGHHNICYFYFFTGYISLNNVGNPPILVPLVIFLFL